MPKRYFSIEKLMKFHEKDREYGIGNAIGKSELFLCNNPEVGKILDLWTSSKREEARTLLEKYIPNKEILKINGHNAGFFSCCSQRLFNIINFFNEKKCLPYSVDSSEQFEFFKDKNEDVSFRFFEDNESDIKYIEPVILSTSNDELQFSNYEDINFEKLTPFIKKYFSPSLEVQYMKKYHIEKYSIYTNNTCAVFYRGNDKAKETEIPSYDIIINKCLELAEKNPTIEFLVQTDEQEFLNEFKKQFTYFKRIEELPVINKQNSVMHFHVNEKFNFGKTFLAATCIISECKFIVTNSGNCGLWSTLFRGNTDNVHQYITAGYYPGSHVSGIKNIWNQ